jgi:hypothetical protein
MSLSLSLSQSITPTRTARGCNGVGQIPSVPHTPSSTWIKHIISSIQGFFTLVKLHGNQETEKACHATCYSACSYACPIVASKVKLSSKTEPGPASIRNCFRKWPITGASRAVSPQCSGPFPLCALHYKSP